jgi:hypothetical protein
MDYLCVWPPQSPNLTPPDFFLWGFLKERVYLYNPRSFDELKHNIAQTVASIDLGTLSTVTQNTIKVVDVCL